MIANKFFSFDALIDLWMTNLFLLAEKVCRITSFTCDDDVFIRQTSHSVEQQKPVVMPTIRFSKEDRMVEGELFESV
jgi:hypothetical protein